MRRADRLALARSPRKASIGFALALAVFAASCSKKAETPEQHLAKANDALEKDHLIEAAKEYREVLRMVPKDPVAQRQLATLYFEQGQQRLAFPLLQKVAQAEPDNLDVQLKLCQVYLTARQFQPAQDLAQQIVGKHPGQDDALMLLASAGIGLKDIDGTRKLLNAVRPVDKQLPGYHTAQGLLLLAQNDQAGAESEFKTALKADPRAARAHAALGALDWARQDLRGAEAELKSAANLAPKRSPIKMELANFLLQTGSLPEAKQFVEQLNKDAPDYLPARVFLMRIACSEEQDETCAAQVASILEQDPPNFDALLQDGKFKLAKGDTAAAAREFEFLNANYSQTPLVRYQLGRVYLQQSRGPNPVESRQALERAETNLTEAVKLNPKFTPAVLALSELKIRKGSAAAAVDYLLPLVKDNPLSAQPQYQLAAAYLAQQNTSEALAIYRRMTELFPKDPQPSFLIGEILLAQNQQADARKAFEKSSEILPDYPPAVESLVNLDIADHQLGSAMDRIQKQVEKNPKSAQVFATRATVYAAQKDFKHAEADLSKSIELDPKFEPSYLLLARIYIATNRQQQAIDKLTAFTKDNNDIPALLQLAELHLNLKHFPEARDAYEKILSTAPNFALALNNLAALYADQLQDLDRAYDLAKRVRDQAPNDPHTGDTLGWVLFKRGEYRDALALLQDSAGKLADQPEIQYHLGMAHYMLGDEEAAKTALQKAAQTTADFSQKPDAQQRLAILSIDTQNPTAATRAKLDDYLRQQPKDPAALTRLAELRQHNGATDQAIEAYQTAIEADPSYAPAVRALAILYSQRPADESKAFDLATKARQAYPNDVEVAKALGILNVQRGLYPPSIELLNQAATTRKDDSEVQYYLGRANQGLNRWDQCKAALKKAIAGHLSRKLADDAETRLANCTEMAAQ